MFCRHERRQLHAHAVGIFHRTTHLLDETKQFFHGFFQDQLGIAAAYISSSIISGIEKSSG